MLKKLLYRLVAEIVVIVVVIGLFQIIPNRLIAGVIAGSIFIGLGFYVVYPGIRDSVFRRTLSFWAAWAHLLLSAFPLFLTRLFHAGSSFEDVRVMGLPGPVFHKVSTTIYMIMLIATLADVVWFAMKNRSPRSER
jgi:hypothetical protein